MDQKDDRSFPRGEYPAAPADQVTNDIKNFTPKTPEPGPSVLAPITPEQRTPKPSSETVEPFLGGKDDTPKIINKDLGGQQVDSSAPTVVSENNQTINQTPQASNPPEAKPVRAWFDPRRYLPGNK